ncbi:MAG: hypothetical protein AAF547_15640 [Actinomycetota bacterium]
MATPPMVDNETSWPTVGLDRAGTRPGSRRSMILAVAAALVLLVAACGQADDVDDTAAVTDSDETATAGDTTTSTEAEDDRTTTADQPDDTTTTTAEDQTSTMAQDDQDPDDPPAEQTESDDPTEADEPEPEPDEDDPLDPENALIDPDDPKPEGPDDSTLPPVDDELLEEVVGLSEEEAIALVRSLGRAVRVAERDGEPMALTMDYRPERVNLTIVNGIVTAARSG